jgi:hypothetical protein
VPTPPTALPAASRESALPIASSSADPDPIAASAEPDGGGAGAGVAGVMVGVAAAGVGVGVGAGAGALGLLGGSRPFASNTAPDPASARSITRTVAMSPVRRRGTGIDSDASGTRAIGGCGCGALGSMTRGGMLGGAYEIGCAACTPGVVVVIALGTGNGASSGIFAVGATRGSDGASFAPQPPQNRESGVFSVLHVGQRIPRQA